MVCIAHCRENIYCLLQNTILPLNTVLTFNRGYGRKASQRLRIEADDPLKIAQTNHMCTPLLSSPT
jgi:hypothetical protein